VLSLIDKLKYGISEWQIFGLFPQRFVSTADFHNPTDNKLASKELLGKLDSQSLWKIEIEAQNATARPQTTKKTQPTSVKQL